MEKANCINSLEKHLKNLAETDEKVKLLHSIWVLNKSNLSSALSSVAHYFPHYSLHDQSHSQTIIKNIELFLGEDRIQKLSASNTWLILMAAFSHDLGMLVIAKIQEDKWQDEHFLQFLESKTKDPDLARYARILVNLNSFNRTGLNTEFENYKNLTPYDIKNAATICTAEYIRKEHHARSFDILTGNDKLFHEALASFYADQIPSRFLHILAEVAYLHGVDFEYLFTRLPFKSNGISNDYIHPRFVACMLKLGDLLDVDNNRFGSIAHLLFNFPKSSQDHRDKHLSIRHILVTPENIELTANCDNESTFRITSQWFDWLKDEVQNQSAEWSKIAPEDLGGGSPRISKDSLKVLLKSQSDDNKVTDLRFNLKSDVALEIVQGQNLYKNPGFVFIRELFQNALDANKLNFWSNVITGEFDQFIALSYEIENPTHEEILETLQTPFNLPEAIVKILSPEITIYWEDSKEENLIFKFSDNGIGISIKDLQHITKNVGSSLSKSSEKQSLIKSIPLWLQPTAAFGIGLQSVFLVSEAIQITTKTKHDHRTFQMILRSGALNEYCSYSEIPESRSTGTEVIVRVKKEILMKELGNKIPHQILIFYDYFTDPFKNLLIHRLIYQIQEDFRNTHFSKISYIHDGKTHTIINNTHKKKNPIEFCVTSKSQEYFTIITKSKESENQFAYCYEQIIGSEIEMSFLHDTFRKGSNYGQINFNFHGISIDSDHQLFNIIVGIEITCNILSPNAKQYIKINRENFLKGKDSEIRNTLFEKVLPYIFEQQLKSLNNNKNALNFFNADQIFLLLINSHNFHLDISRLVKAFSKKIISRDFAAGINDNAIDIGTFFSSELFLIISTTSKTNQSDLKKLKYLISNLPENTIKIESESTFRYFLSKNYSLSRIHYISNTISIQFIEKSDTSIKITGDIIEYYKSYIYQASSLPRSWRPAIQKYFGQLAVPKALITGFEDQPTYANYTIISPIDTEKKWKEASEFIKTNKIKSNKSFSEEFIHFIKDKMISTDLIQYIINNKPESAEKRTNESVVFKYAELIMDIYKSQI